MVDDKPDGDAESAGGGVVDAPEWFESKTTCSTSAGGGAVELQWRQRRLLGAAGFPSLPASPQSVGRWEWGRLSWPACLCAPTSSI